MAVLSSIYYSTLAYPGHRRTQACLQSFRTGDTYRGRSALLPPNNPRERVTAYGQVNVILIFPAVEKAQHATPESPRPTKPTVIKHPTPHFLVYPRSIVLDSGKEIVSTAPTGIYSTDPYRTNLNRPSENPRSISPWVPSYSP